MTSCLFFRLELVAEVIVEALKASNQAGSNGMTRQNAYLVLDEVKDGPPLKMELAGVNMCGAGESSLRQQTDGDGKQEENQEGNPGGNDGKGGPSNGGHGNEQRK
ncbi:hypothetical protein OROMI_009769 [Orobanche minor]